MSVVVLIPLKPPSEAKERLAGILTHDERRELAEATLRTVVQAVTAAGLSLAVVTPDTTAAVALLPPGVPLIAESPDVRGLSAQIEHALAQPFFTSFDHVLILHADLPLASSEALGSFAVQASEGVTMVESADGGTNALLSPMPLGFVLQYGKGSFAKHQAAAQVAGLAVQAFASPALALDLDTPDDLRTLLGDAGGRSSPAGQILLRWELPRRLATG